MVPVKAVGKNIVEIRTGKVVAHAKSAKNAKISARIRNQAIAEKHRKSKRARRRKRSKSK